MHILFEKDDGFSLNKKLDTHGRNVRHGLLALCSEMPRLRASFAEMVDDGFSLFCRLLATLLSDLAAAR